MSADFRLGRWLIRPDLNLIEGSEGETTVEPKVMEVLVCLARRPGEVVYKEQLMRAVWPDTFVTDEVLTNAIWELRKAFRDEAKQPKVIQTIFKKGYRLIAPVSFDTEKLREEALRESGGVVHPIDRRWPRHRSAWLAGLLAIAVLLSAVVWLGSRRATSERPTPAMTATPLTSYPGHELQPALSPDGNQVAFVWNGEKEDNYDIYVKVIDAPTPLRLTHDPADDLSPTWSPDGRHIAFVRYFGSSFEILQVPVTGGQERKLYPVSLPSGSASSSAPVVPIGPSGSSALAWCPDGKFLAFSERISPRELHGIFLLSMDDLGTRRLTSPPPGSIMGDRNPIFSPDGRTVAFIRWISPMGGDIHLVPLASGDSKRLTSGHIVPGCAWTRDGRQLVFSTWSGGIQTLWRVSVSGGTPERLAVGGQNAGAPSISRQGHRLAFVEEYVDNDIWRFEVNQQTGALGLPSRLIQSTRFEAGPQFSPDGKKIVFSSLRSGTSEIWVCDSDGSNPLQLTFTLGDRGTPRWSPDGAYIAFDDRQYGKSRDVFIVGARGGVPRRLTSFASDEVRPSWSRDGLWIYFGSNRSGDWQVWKMPAAGGDALQVTKHGGQEAFESFDGKHVYYSKERWVPGIWRVGVQGGEETLVVDQGRFGYWGLTARGIYFVIPKETNQASVEFFSFATNRTRRLAVIKTELALGPPGFAVSPDDRWILLSQVARRDRDLMLVENFQ